MDICHFNSQIHMIMDVRSVAGRLEERYRYSKDVVYNTFPFPNISRKTKRRDN